MPQPDELTLAIARVLEVDWQYVERVEAWDTERIAEVRSAGRNAGRLLGFKIVTHQSHPDDESRVVVIVAVREPPSAEEAQRMMERARLLMDDYWSKLLPEPEAGCTGVPGADDGRRLEVGRPAPAPAAGPSGPVVFPLRSHAGGRDCEPAGRACPGEGL